MENNTSKKTSDNVLTKLDKTRYCTLKTQHGCNISQPAYTTDANGNKHRAFKMVTDEKTGDDKKQYVNEFSENVNFTIPFGMDATLDYVVVEMHTVTLYIDVIDPLPIV